MKPLTLLPYQGQPPWVSRISAAEGTAAKPPKNSQPPKNPAVPYDFDTQFNLLVEYKKEHGNCNAPSNTRLGRWAALLRQKFREMNDNKEVDDFSGNANGGDGNAHSRRWVQAPPGRLGLAVQFVEDKEGAEVTAIFDACPFKTKVREGDLIVEIDGKSVAGPEDLSIGTEKYRSIGIERKKKAPKVSLRSLTQEQIARLNEIDFNWEGSGRFRPWELSFQDLLTYYQTRGDFRVPRAYITDDNHPLGEWVHRQRYRYSKKDPTFMTERAPKLEVSSRLFGGGFFWTPSMNPHRNNTGGIFVPQAKLFQQKLL